MNRKIIFIGSRFNVLKHCLALFSLKDLTILALKESFLEKELLARELPYKSFSLNEKQGIIDYLLTEKFQILISNGCPFILPVDSFSNQQYLLNIHPTYLPHLQGKTPINGIFYESYDFYGATMHMIDRGIDTGNIVYQERKDLTPDIDLGLLYYLSMRLEGVVFDKGWKLLEKSGFEYRGIRQSEKGSYFNRMESMQILDFEKMNTNEILTRIHSFGVCSQGCSALIDNERYIIFDASEIVHKPLLEEFKESNSGHLVLSYDEKLLVKTLDGIIKVTRFKQPHSML